MDYIPIGEIKGGLPKTPDLIPLRFILNNPIKTPNGFSEGFYIYYLKNELDLLLNKNIFMIAEFNNAKLGLSTNLVTTNSPLFINDLKNKLYSKYILERNDSGYYYKLDNSFSDNIYYSSDVDGDGNLVGGTLDSGVIIKLYEMQII